MNLVQTVRGALLSKASSTRSWGQDNTFHIFFEDKDDCYYSVKRAGCLLIRAGITPRRGIQFDRYVPNTLAILLLVLTPFLCVCIRVYIHEETDWTAVTYSEDGYDHRRCQICEGFKSRDKEISDKGPGVNG
jgi:hypothetical protein